MKQIEGFFILCFTHFLSQKQNLQFIRYPPGFYIRQIHLDTLKQFGDNQHIALTILVHLHYVLFSAETTTNLILESIQIYIPSR